MSTAALAASARSLGSVGTAAIVDPCIGNGYAEAFSRKGWRTVAVRLDAGLKPSASTQVGLAGPYTDTVEHHGSLRRTVRALGDAGATTVVAGSAAGISLADRIASQLQLPGGDPDTSQLRYDRGAQAAALAAAGIPAPRSLRTTSLSEAMRWAELLALPSYVLAPATAGAAIDAVVCTNELQICTAWPTMRRAAARCVGDAHLVLTEDVPGRQYLVYSVTRSGPDGLPDHCVSDIWAETRFVDGQLDRTDLLVREPLLTRALSVYMLRTLDVLGVVRGPVLSRIAYGASRGPVLISAVAAPQPSLADEALRTVLGRTRAEDAVEAWTSPFPAEQVQGPAGRRVVRVHLRRSNVGFGRDPWLSRILRQLPTVVAVSADLQPHAETATAASSGAGAEIVLSSDEPEAVEADYRVVRALEREGLNRGGRS